MKALEDAENESTYWKLNLSHDGAFGRILGKYKQSDSGADENQHQKSKDGRIEGQDSNLVEALWLEWVWNQMDCSFIDADNTRAG